MYYFENTNGLLRLFIIVCPFLESVNDGNFFHREILNSFYYFLCQVDIVENGSRFDTFYSPINLQWKRTNFKKEKLFWSKFYTLGSKSTGSSPRQSNTTIDCHSKFLSAEYDLILSLMISADKAKLTSTWKNIILV